MSLQTINNTNVSPDSLYSAGTKMNANFAELYAMDTTLSGLTAAEAITRAANDAVLSGISTAGLALKADIFNPSNTAFFYDDFMGGTASTVGDHVWGTSFSIGSTMTRNVGVDGWGIIRLTTNASNNATAEIQTPTETAGMLGIRGMSGLTYKTRVKAKTTITSVQFYVGFNGDGNGIGNNGIYFIRTSGNWILRCSAANVDSDSDTGIAPVIDTFQTLEFRVNAAGTSVQAYIDNVAAGTAVTEHIPTVGVYPYFSVTNLAADGNTKQMEIDYVYITQALSR